MQRRRQVHSSHQRCQPCPVPEEPMQRRTNNKISYTGLHHPCFSLVAHDNLLRSTTANRTLYELRGLVNSTPFDFLLLALCVVFWGVLWNNLYLLHFPDHVRCTRLHTESGTRSSPPCFSNLTNSYHIFPKQFSVSLPQRLCTGSIAKP